LSATTQIKSQVIRPLVLLVDDEPAVLGALEALLAPRLEPWFRLISARSVPEALEALAAEDEAESPLALVISDEKMPGGAGTDLLVQLRDRPGHQHGGRIIVTGYASLDSAKRAINDAEVARYYPKPWDAEGALLPAVGEILEGFLRRRSFDRLQLAEACSWTDARQESLALRQAWWEYVHLMGLPAAELDVKAPEFEQSVDASATHVLIRECSPSERYAIAAARLVRQGPSAGLEEVAYLPGAATDEVEALLVRTASNEARRAGAARLSLTGNVVRSEFYAGMGLAPAGREEQTSATSLPVQEWVKDVNADAGDPWGRRYSREGRLCACSQLGCTARDYAAARRQYYCPLDQLEHRVPAGFPGLARSSRS
jgi:CheY-like chemotaxis protein